MRRNEATDSNWYHQESSKQVQIDAIYNQQTDTFSYGVETYLSGINHHNTRKIESNSVYHAHLKIISIQERAQEYN